MEQVLGQRRDAARGLGILAAAAAATAGAAALTRLRRPSRRGSPAQLEATPRRDFYAGDDLSHALTVDDLRAIAHRRLPRFALEYLEGGAEEEATLSRNRAALAEWGFKRRALVDVSRREPSRFLFGRPMAMPLAIAPTGLNELFWPHADLRLAEAAAAAGVPFVQSTMSNDPMQRIAQVPGLRHWWQLYVFGPPEVRRTLVERADRHGCEALVVTTDAQIYGNREWEKRVTGGGTSLSWQARLEALARPGWLARGPLTHGMPQFANVIEFVPKRRRSFFDSAHWIRSQMDTALDWDEVRRLRDRWPRRLILKGLLSIEDVERARDIGADAVALSNHGGRQLDWAVSPLDVLPAARQAVGNRIAIIVDGGFRRGSDVIKALALGADAVLVGRAALYGVAAAGRAGAARGLDILRQELERDLGLIGVPRVTELAPAILSRRGPQPFPSGLIGSE